MKIMNNTYEQAVKRVYSLMSEYGIDNYVLTLSDKRNGRVDIATATKGEKYGDVIVLVSYLIFSITKKFQLDLKEVFEDVVKCFSALILKEEE